MCGVIGIVSHGPVNQLIYDGLLCLQHRGQDAAGIMTADGAVFHMHKAKRNKVVQILIFAIIIAHQPCVGWLISVKGERNHSIGNAVGKVAVSFILKTNARHRFSINTFF